MNKPGRRLAMKVSFFNKNLKKQFSAIFGVLSLLLSTGIIFVDIPKRYKILAGILFLVILFLTYLILWIIANNRRRILIKIGLTTVEIKSGDIFQEKGLKAVAFNEYFDTTVDDCIISKASINGQLLLNHIDDVLSIDKAIEDDKCLQRNVINVNDSREKGKKKQYKLGSSILIENEFIITAFSKFNEDNEANLTIQEYVKFLLSFWNEINRLYAQRSVTVPVFGAGITRFKNGFEDIDINELLRIMIWTFKISKIKFAYPAKLTIIIHDGIVDKVNLYDLKEHE